MFVVCPRTGLVTCNDAYLSLSNLVQDDLRQPDLQRAPWLDEQEQTFMQEIRAGKRDNYTMEMQLATKSGSQLWVKLTYTRLENTPAGWVLGIIEDISEHKQTQLALEKQNATLNEAMGESFEHLVNMQQRTTAILDSSPDTILLLDTSNTITTTNLAFREQFMVGLDEYNGTSFLDLIYPADLTQTQAALNAVKETYEVVRLEARVVRKDMSLFDAGIAFAAVLDGGHIIGIVCTIRDISGFKEIERMKDSLIDTVSHELNTPITNFRVYHHLLEAQPEKASQYLDVMEQEIDRLEGIVKEVITMSKLAQDDIASETVSETTSLRGSMQRVVQSLTELANSKAISVDVEDSSSFDTVEGSPQLIAKVLRTLLNNAIHYTPQGGTVLLQLYDEERFELAGVSVTVTDDGMGLSQKDKDNLFSRFYRGQAASRTVQSGAGLGLAMAREIVHQSRGEIDFFSAGIDQGSTFTVWFPIV